MKTKSATVTKVKLNIKHDSLLVDAVFANGDKFRYFLSRASERLLISQFPSNPQLGKDQAQSIHEFTKFHGDTDNKMRFERIAAACEKSKDLIELAMLTTAANAT